jgi:glycosyltransferase involved in cell wall biosynthesis
MPDGLGDREARPLVSVIMPNLNKGDFIADAIESVLSQVYDNLELIVVDNGSLDQSVSIVEEFVKSDHRVTLLKEAHRGTSFARNTGIRKARGTFIALSDADDVCHKERLSKQVNLLQERNGSVCYSEGWIIDGRGMPTGQFYNRDLVKLPNNYEGSIFHELIKYDFVIGPSVMVSRSCLDNDPFDVSITLCDDWDLNVRLSRRVDFHYIPEPLYGYRIYSGNAKRTMVQEKYRNHILMFEEWLERFGNLDKRDRDIILGNLLRAREAQSGRVGMIRVGLTHPSAAVMLLAMTRSYVAHQLRLLLGARSMRDH